MENYKFKWEKKMCDSMYVGGVRANSCPWVLAYDISDCARFCNENLVPEK